MDTSIPYTRLDRFLHSLAFKSDILLEMMLDIEKSISSRSAETREVVPPVFVTSLPRAGTTILLEVLYRLPDVVSHTYRDMPFILTPVLWKKLSGAFRKQTALRERAHGDGLQVNEDSPEAFEEVIWKYFFPEKFQRNCIELWTESDVTPEFLDYFKRYRANMIALHASGEVSQGIYISKNNGNVSRLGFLKAAVPGARFLVPFRDPFEHSLSMLRQHENFLVQHRDEPFIEKYMADIGHFEFGCLHKPIDFPGMDEVRTQFDPGSIDYWLSYWCCAYDYLLEMQSLCLVSYEAFATNGKRSLARIADLLNLQATEEEMDWAAAVLRPPPQRSAVDASIPAELQSRVEAVYLSLQARCILAA